MDVYHSYAFDWKHKTCGLSRATSLKYIRRLFNVRYKWIYGYNKAEDKSRNEELKET